MSPSAARRPLRIGINGFGRIGRSLLRIILGRADLEVVAVNDLCAPETLAQLARHDSIMGPLGAEVAITADGIQVGAHAIRATACRAPAQIPWREADVDVVVEATGRFTARADLAGHLAAGAPRVLLTVPPKDAVDYMVVLGVNDAGLRPEHQLVSNASCTTNCLAPVAKVLDDAFGIRTGLMTTTHAYTNDQRLHDAPHRDLRRSRAAAQNIIPTSTGAARAVGKVLPRLAGRLDGMAARVPIIDGSLIDLVVALERPVTLPALHAALRAAAAGPMRGVLAVSEAPLVLRDIVGDPHSAIVDAPLTQVNGPNHARVVAWYDNEWGYANRCADVLTRMAP